ncbi:hypothetical protein QO014_000793 [Kaistia dalseonensis]|uniref:Glyoxalase-like domain-containing protein n=2 Tax=Kaistia dalseonensis TaxID=410840 RepID=A0ABU0H3F0_9HYPH|nr:hypothetical protein [Kaistia dalseonensis]
MGGSYIELLALNDVSRIPEPTEATFSFAAFNRDFLARREGLSMLVLKSYDAEADRQRMAASGLRTYDIAHFERLARGPDGVERKVAFSLAFTSSPMIDDAGFFSCQHHFPENFWRPEYQCHANGAARVAGVRMVAQHPEEVAPFLCDFAGANEARIAGESLSIAIGDDELIVLPTADQTTPHFAAIEIAVADLDQTERHLLTAHMPFERVGQTLVVPASASHGVDLVFSDRGR